MIDKITINGITYKCTVTENPQDSDNVVTVDGVTYVIGEQVSEATASDPTSVVGNIEKIVVNGQLYDIRDVEDVAKEAQRAKDEEQKLSTALQDGLNQEATARGNLAKNIRENAMQYNTLGVNVYADKAEIYGRSINATPRTVEFPAATTEKAGVMSAKDKEALNKAQSVENVTWSALSNVNNYINAGVYDITGTRGSLNDNLPITNLGENATIAARLIVTVTPEGNTTYRHSVGQTLILSNAEGKETKVYTRNGNRTSTDGGVTYTVTWGEWANLQENVQVQVTGENGLDNLINNGIYSGVWVKNDAYIETFVMVVINNYAAAGQVGAPKSITQFKYSITVGGSIPIYETRVGASERDWGKWENINANEFEDIRSKALQTNTFTVDTVYSDHVNLYMRTLDGDTRIEEIPAATEKTAGVMTAEDKKIINSLDSAIEEGEKRVLRRLFIAAGAEYNDSGADKAKTAPWGEIVTHKAGHYYLNGLGDITEEQMTKIYNSQKNVLYPQAYTQFIGSRTYISDVGQNSFAGSLDLSLLCAGNYNLEVFGNEGSPQIYFNEGNLNCGFWGCTKLKHIASEKIFVKNARFISTFKNCGSLITVKFQRLSSSISFSDSPNISKDSILYLINKAQPSSAITITLHPDAYARLTNDADVVAALEAQPLISLVSA